MFMVCLLITDVVSGIRTIFNWVLRCLVLKSKTKDVVDLEFLGSAL